MHITLDNVHARSLRSSDVIEPKVRILGDYLLFSSVVSFDMWKSMTLRQEKICQMVQMVEKGDLLHHKDDAAFTCHCPVPGVHS